MIFFFLTRKEEAHVAVRRFSEKLQTEGWAAKNWQWRGHGAFWRSLLDFTAELEIVVVMKEAAHISEGGARED